MMASLYQSGSSCNPSLSPRSGYSESEAPWRQPQLSTPKFQPGISPNLFGWCTRTMSTLRVGNPWQRLQSSATARVLVSVYVPSMIMSFGQGMVVPTIPRVATAFDVSPGLAAQLVTATFLGSTLGLLPAGILIDRAGR